MSIKVLAVIIIHYIYCSYLREVSRKTDFCLACKRGKLIGQKKGTYYFYLVSCAL